MTRSDVLKNAATVAGLGVLPARVAFGGMGVTIPEVRHLTELFANPLHAGATGGSDGGRKPRCTWTSACDKQTAACRPSSHTILESRAS